MATQLLRKEFHTTLANQFVRDIQLSRANYYYYLGRAITWGGSDVPPTSIVESLGADNIIRDNILYLRKISPNDVSLVATRYTWTTGTIYNRWDSTVDMRALPFYVVTSTNKVYKCLDNNNGSASTVQPSTVNYTQVETADGYVWKYMYTIPAFKNLKFSNTDYIPVQRAVSDSFYNNGAIEDVVIAEPGVGYTTASIAVAGDGTGAVLAPVLSGGEIVGVTISNAGTGYSYVELTVTGDGTGARLTAAIGLNDIVSDQSVVEQTAIPGAIYGIKVTTAGSGYGTTVPTVTISGDGTGATATAYLSAGTVSHIIVDTFGSNYSYANVVIDAPLEVGGVQAVASIIEGPTNGHGFDAVEELFADRVAISSVLQANSLLTEINQDYRQYGILRNPSQIGSLKSATVENELACWKVKFANTAGLVVDQYLKFEEHVFVVVKFDASNVFLQQLSSANITPLGAITTLDGATTFSITEVITSPTINKYTGSLILISNEEPFTFTTEQKIALKTYIKL
jgi:hypothetical protein